MGNYVTLMGAEQVQSAGHTMARAAEEMRNAAGTIDCAGRDLRMALVDHQQFLTGFLEQLQEIIVAGNQKRVAGDRVAWLLERHAELMRNDGLGPVQDAEGIKSILAIEDELAARGHPLEHSKTHTGSIDDATRSAR